LSKLTHTHKYKKLFLEPEKCLDGVPDRPGNANELSKNTQYKFSTYLNIVRRSDPQEKRIGDFLGFGSTVGV
jgi:hypothetical protein